MKLIFLHADKHESLLQIDKKEVRDEVDFLHADKHQNFLQVDFNTFGIKDPYKVILSFLLGMIKHSQRSSISKVTMSLQCIKKKKLGREFIFSLQMNLKASYRLISTLWGIKDAYQGDTFITAGYDQAFSKY